ncbi:hypothetical protein B0H11DRAFT_2354759, partial [Mycena galericulata]
EFERWLATRSVLHHVGLFQVFFFQSPHHLLRPLMSSARNTAFAASDFAQNQPQQVGRTHRVSAQTEAYTRHRAQLEKNAQSGAQRTETRRRNQAARPDVASLPPTTPSHPNLPTTPTVATIVQPQSATPATAVQPQSTPRSHLQQHAPGMSRPVLHPIQQLGQSTPSPVLPVRGFTTSTPLLLPLQRLQNDFQPRYADFQGRARPTVTEPGRGLVSAMDPAVLDNMLSMLEASGYTIPPMERTPELTLDPALLRHDNDGSRLDSSGYDGTRDDDGRDALIGRDAWNSSDYQGPSQDDPGPEQDEGPQSDDGGHHNAQSLLEVRMHDVPVHQRRPRRPREAVPSADTSDLDEEEQRPKQRRRRESSTTGPTKEKKRAGRTQPSRSISAVPAARQPIVKAAYTRIQERIIVDSAFPVDSPSGRPGEDDDEFGNMVIYSFEDANDGLELPDAGRPTSAEKNLIRARAPTARLSFKDAAKVLAPAAYGFVDLQTLSDPTSDKIADAIQANRDIYEKIEQTWFYMNPFDANVPDSMYRHPILQGTFNIACFGEHSRRRGHYFSDMEGIPLVTLALIVAAVKCAIDEWKTGRRVDKSFDYDPYAQTYNDALKHLTGWVSFSATQPVNVISPLLKEMLRVARDTATSAPAIEATVEPSSIFSFAAYAANQPQALVVTPTTEASAVTADAPAP